MQSIEEMDHFVQTWEDVAEEKQQEWYELFGDRDWDKYKTTPCDIHYLMRNVGHALYGLPDTEPDESNLKTGYSESKLTHIKKVCEMIKNHNVHKNASYEEVFIGIIFLYLKIDVLDFSHIPVVVFRVMKDGSKDHTQNVFIDSECRSYTGWSDYLKNNQLPKCTYCYPRNGVYYGNDDDEVFVDFGTTPAASLKRKVLDGVDMAGSVIAVGATVVSAAAMAMPVAAPILLGTAVSGALVGAYGIGRNVDTIVDRKSHDQSISLNDSSARYVWFSLGANTLGMVAAGATKMASVVARSGNVLGKGGQFAVNAAQVGAIAANGINIVNTVFVLRNKSKSESLTPLDIFQFTASVLFFTNSVVNLKSANTIIRESQQNVLQNFESKLRSNRHTKAYARLARNTRSGLDTMHGDAKVIRGIVNISNPDDFFSGVVRTQKLFGKHQAEVSFSECGKISINKELIVDPSQFAEIGKSQRGLILEASKQHAVGQISKPQFEATVNPILNENGLMSIDPQSISKISNAFGVKTLTEVKLGGKSILSSIQPNEVDFLLRLSAKLLSPYIIPTAQKIADQLNLHTLKDFLGFLDFFNDFIKKLLKEMECAYMDMVNIAKTWPGFNQTQFDLSNGIAVNREEQFINVILKMHSIGEGFMQLGRSYKEYRQSKLGASGAGTTNEQSENQSEAFSESSSRPGVSGEGRTNPRLPASQLRVVFENNGQSGAPAEEMTNNEPPGFSESYYQSGSLYKEITSYGLPGFLSQAFSESNYQSVASEEEITNELPGFRSEDFSEMMISRVHLRKKRPRMEIN